MSETFSGRVDVTNGSGEVTVRVNGDHGNIRAGGNGQDGDLFVLDTAGNSRIHVDGQSGKIRIMAADGTTVANIGMHGNAYLGGAGQDGDLVLRDGDGNDCVHIGAGEKNLIIKQADGTKIIEIGVNGNIYAGGGGHDGDLVLRDGSGNSRIHLDAGQGNGWFGGNGADGDLVLFPSSANNINDVGQASIHLNGEAGDIILKNADCAEDFDVEATCMTSAKPGTVMVIDEAGKLRPCGREYDKRVAGVVSGGGKYRPGIVLDKQHGAGNRLPLALVGKVYCKVDARYGSVGVGDLLTTSATIGHAMKAEEPEKAFGAVIGKALEPLEKGCGVVPVLVALQ